MDEETRTVLATVLHEIAHLRRAVEALQDGLDPDCYLDIEGGETRCPTCRGIVRVVPHRGALPTVADRDGQRHKCQRQIAATFLRHGVTEFAPLVEAAAPPRPRPDAPSPQRVSERTPGPLDI